MKRLIYSLLLLAVLGAEVTPQVYLPHRRKAFRGGYAANATTFAGDDQCWLERDGDLTGNADGKSFTISFWVDFASGDNSARRIFHNENGRLRMTREGGNTLRLTLCNSAGTALVDIETAGTLVAAGGWYHVMISVDKSVETRRHLYINGVSDLGSVHTFLSDDVDGNTDNIDWTQNDWSIGDFIDGGAGALAGCLSEFYISHTYIDLSNSSNRDIFYNAAGPPQSLAAVNSPIIYLSSDFGNFHVNSGSGGNFVKKGTTDFTSCTAP